MNSDIYVHYIQLVENVTSLENSAITVLCLHSIEGAKEVRRARDVEFNETYLRVFSEWKSIEGGLLTGSGENGGLSSTVVNLVSIQNNAVWMLRICSPLAGIPYPPISILQSSQPF
jgi:hypothetical protein